MADILIVDDEPDIRMLLSLVLSGEGHRVREAADGAAALEVLAVQPPDLVLLDVMMPNLDGFGVLHARKHRELAPDARFVMLTCRAAERDFARAWESGADAYLLKPFGHSVLMATVGRVLRSTSQQLQTHREAELAKAAVLNQIDAMFNRPTPAQRV